MHRIKSEVVQEEMVDIIDRFLESIERRFEATESKQIELDIDDHIMRYALALFFSCFYKQPNLINFDADRDWWQERIEEGFKDFDNPFLRLCGVLPGLLPVFELMLNWFTTAGKVKSKVKGYINQQTMLYFKNRQEDISGPTKSYYKLNLVDYITRQLYDGNLTPIEYHDNTFFLFFAANKTSADSVARLIYLIAHHPEVQEKLRKSIEAEGEESTYMSWTINETLRLYPPAPIGAARVVTRDIQTKHGLIPSGTCVISSTTKIHRMEEYWGTDANEFRPERWSEADKFHPCQFMAFGAGKRRCLGANLATHEIKMLLNRMVRKYRFDTSPRTKGDILYKSPLLIYTVADEPVYIRLSKLHNS